jgi:hypothetical protein
MTFLPGETADTGEAFEWPEDECEHDFECDWCEDTGCELCDPDNHQMMWMKGIACESESLQETIDHFQAMTLWLEDLKAEGFEQTRQDNGHFFFSRQSITATSSTG